MLFHEEQALYEDDGTKQPVNGEEMVTLLAPNKTVVLMKNHGAVILGASLEDTTIKAITLEEAARYHLEAEAIGGTEFPEAEVVRGRAQYEKFYVPEMWKANFRRLERSDPDLFALLN